METRFACGSRGRFLSFLQEFYTECGIFVQKKGIFHPAGGDRPFRVSDRVSPIYVPCLGIRDDNLQACNDYALAMYQLSK